MSHDRTMNTKDADRLTVGEFLGLFGCNENESRRFAAVDSEEYLALVTYLLERHAAR